MARKTIKASDITTAGQFEKALGDILTGKANYVSDAEPQVPVDPNSAHAKRNAARKVTDEQKAAMAQAVIDGGDGTLQWGTAGTVTVGVTVYPAIKEPAGVVWRSSKANGEGKWVVVRSPKNAETFAAAVTEADKERGDAAMAVVHKAKDKKAAKVPAEKRPVIQEDGKFYRVRGNGTRRAIPLLEGTALEQARTIKTSRDGANGQKPMTVREIAEGLHMSTSTVRRLLVSLELTEQQLAGQAAPKAAKGARKTKAS